MTISAQRFATKTRTWLLIAGLTALLIGIGALIGGVWLYVFVALAVAMNVGGYWFPDRLALPVSRANRVEPGTRPNLEVMVQDLAWARRASRAADVHDPFGAAERVRDGPQPWVRRGRGHRGPGSASRLSSRRYESATAADVARRHIRLGDGDDRRMDRQRGVASDRALWPTPRRPGMVMPWTCFPRCRWPSGRTQKPPCTGSPRWSARSDWPPASGVITGGTSRSISPDAVSRPARWARSTAIRSSRSTSTSSPTNCL